MQFTTIFTAVVATLASTATAAPAAKKYSASASVFAMNQDGYKSILVPFGVLTHMDYRMTSLEVRGVFVDLPEGQDVDLNKVKCQMYKDSVGTQRGSDVFTRKTPARVSTNPVEFGWVLCYVDVA
ncbi:hypothetical protein CEP54_011415 [Fusarium duplospermum]|uniref:Uncharacterized protein n=1 Tax=Fusarium duplospermum TaxID=1325734 RepID=A0A428PEU0_9HYPO|nr:hypothetical protein CEP54_011415 [Fusarium duplospermum]